VPSIKFLAVFRRTVPTSTSLVLAALSFAAPVLAEPAGAESLTPTTNAAAAATLRGVRSRPASLTVSQVAMPLAAAAPSEQPSESASAPSAPAQLAPSERFVPLRQAPWAEQATSPRDSAAPVATPNAARILGAFQLGVGVGLLRYASLAAAAAQRDESTSWGFPRAPLLLDVGYGLSERVVLGAQLGFAGESGAADSRNARQRGHGYEFMLGPKFDFVIAPRSSVSPFIGALASVGTGAAGSSSDSIKSSLFRVGLRGGLRYFALHGLSLDPALSVAGVFGSKSAAGGSSNDVSGLEVGASLGMSAWFK
jgi:hypothetical protein